jgi:hypothetical protein
MASMGAELLADSCCRRQPPASLPRAATGHTAAAPPTSVMNSRRLMFTPQKSAAYRVNWCSERGPWTDLRRTFTINWPRSERVISDPCLTPCPCRHDLDEPTLWAPSPPRWHPRGPPKRGPPIPPAVAQTCRRSPWGHLWPCAHSTPPRVHHRVCRMERAGSAQS